MAPTKGNFISEWFGQRIYPQVRLDTHALAVQKASQCPFLSHILNNTTACVKGENSLGVCAISSGSNGSRQDWLVCPYRVIDSDIVKQGCKLIFGLDREVLPKPVSLLTQPGELQRFKDDVVREGVGYLFFQDKLGGEISIVGTDRSPEMAFDVTLVEVRPGAGSGFIVTRYGILEIQTMDFHGSYKLAVTDLRDALRLHSADFAEALQKNPQWAGKKVEGPNIANVFKRTFYQVMLKFKLSGEGAAAAGTLLALPRSVWDSWQPFLGAPELEDESPGIKRFKLIEGGAPEPALNAFICVFDLDASNASAISPIRIEYFVRVSPERLAHHAFTEVPNHILHAINTNDSVLSRIRTRLSDWWPDLQARSPAKRRSRKALTEAPPDPPTTAPEPPSGPGNAT
jgi:hypothetical protein